MNHIVSVCGMGYLQQFVSIDQTPDKKTAATMVQPNEQESKSMGNSEKWWKWFFNEIAQWCNWICNSMVALNLISTDRLAGCVPAVIFKIVENTWNTLTHRTSLSVNKLTEQHQWIEWVGQKSNGITNSDSDTEFNKIIGKQTWFWTREIKKTQNQPAFSSLRIHSVKTSWWEWIQMEVYVTLNILWMNNLFLLLKKAIKWAIVHANVLNSNSLSTGRHWYNDTSLIRQ